MTKHAPLSLIFIAATALLLSTLLLAPSASAAPSATMEADVASQLAMMQSGGLGSCAPASPAAPTLAAGTPYYVQSGLARASGALAATDWYAISIGGAVQYHARKDGVIDTVASGAAVRLVNQVNLSANHTYSTIELSPSVTGALSYSCLGGSTMGAPYGWTGPGGIGSLGPASLGSPASLAYFFGLVTDGTGNDPTAIAFTEPPAAPLSEAAVLNTERDNTVTSSAPLNAARELWNTTGSNSGTSVSEIMAQSFPYNAAIGRYLAQASWIQTPLSTSTCSGTVSVSVLNTLQTPYSTSAELSNITAAFARSAGIGSAVVTADFLNGTLYSNNAATGISFGAPTLSQAGAIVTTTASLPPDLSLSSVDYLRVAFWATTCTAATSYPMVDTTADVTSGGDLWTADAAGAWTEHPNQDARSDDFRAYGGGKLTFNLTTNPQNVGGALYATIEVDKKDTPTAYGIQPVSNLFGPAIYGSGVTNALTSLVATNEWRIGYFSMPYSAAQSLTLTIDTAPIGRNLLYSVAYPTQTPSPDITNLTLPGAAGAISAHELMSTNDWNTTLNVQLLACAGGASFTGASCSQPGGALPNASWFTTGLQPAQGGLTNATGGLTMSGQQVGGVLGFGITFSLSGYVTQTYEVTAPQGTGTTNLTLYLFLSNTGGATAYTSLVACQPSSAAFAVPQAANISLTFSQPFTYYFTFAKMLGGNPVIIQPMQSVSLVSPNITYPLRGWSGDGSSGSNDDRGSYALLVLNSTAVIVQACPFTIGSAGQPQDPFPLNAGALAALQAQLDPTALPSVTQGQANQAVNTEGIIQRATDFAFQVIWLIPNMYWLPIVLGALAAVGIAVGARR